MTEKLTRLVKNLTNEDDKSDVQETLLNVADSLDRSGTNEAAVYMALEDVVRVMRNNYGD